MVDVVLLSGGYDSAVLKKYLNNPNLLTYHANIFYPKNASYNLMETNVVGNTDLKGLISLDKTIEDYIPTRNSSLVLNCANACLAKGYEEVTIYIGLIKNFPRFPDATEQWVESINKLLDVEFQGKVKVVAPFINMTKDDVFKLGCKLGVKLDETFSCNFETIEGACGVCNNCLWRAKHQYPRYERRKNGR